MPAELICPRCQQTLAQQKMAHGIFWACQSCGGRALGLDLLRRTFTAELINPVWQRTVRREGFAGPACPGCTNPMLEIRLSEEEEPPMIDVCRLCHFLWFDARELEHLTPKPISRADPRERPPKQPARGILQPTGSSPYGVWEKVAEFLMTEVSG